MKKPLLLLAVAVLLGACSTSARWTHPNFSVEKWNQDSYECERDARQTINPNNDLLSAQFRNFYERCLYGRGWTKLDGEAPRASIQSSPQPAPQSSSQASQTYSQPSQSYSGPSSESSSPSSPSLQAPSPFDQIVGLVDAYGVKVKSSNNQDLIRIKKEVSSIVASATTSMENGGIISFGLGFSKEGGKAIVIVVPLRNLKPIIVRYKGTQVLDKEIISIEKASRLSSDFINFWQTRDIKFTSNFYQNM